VALGPHVSIILHHGVKDRGQHSAVRSTIAAEPVEHELGDGSVTNQVGPP